MKRTDEKYQAYIRILEEELVPAMGCTEPIALAYAAARAREVLVVAPDRVEIRASGSIIKNVKSVIVPNTGKMKGIPAAAAAGIVAGDAGKKLEVLAGISGEKIPQIKDFLEQVPIDVEHSEDGEVFDLIVAEYNGKTAPWCALPIIIPILSGSRKTGKFYLPQIIRKVRRILRRIGAF